MHRLFLIVGRPEQHADPVTTSDEDLLKQFAAQVQTELSPESAVVISSGTRRDRRSGEILAPLINASWITSFDLDDCTREGVVEQRVTSLLDAYQSVSLCVVFLSEPVAERFYIFYLQESVQERTKYGDVKVIHSREFPLSDWLATATV